MCVMYLDSMDYSRRQTQFRYIRQISGSIMIFQMRSIISPIQTERIKKLLDSIEMTHLLQKVPRISEACIEPSLARDVA